MQYWSGLDGLRALAILLVVFFHSDVPGFYGGNVGVDIFFVLSGFLITRSLLFGYAGESDFLGFYWRRFVRLMPALLLFLLVYCFFSVLFWEGYYFHLRDALFMFLYVSNISIVMGVSPDKLLHGWSLGVEEQFYLLWPWLFLCLFKLRSFSILLWAYASLVIYRFLLTGCCFEDYFYYRVDLHATGLLLGAILAVYLERLLSLGIDKRLLVALGALLLSCAVFFERSPQEHLAYNVLLAELSAFCFVLSVLQGGLCFSNSLLVHIGRLSYGVYLYHYPVSRFLLESGYEWCWVFGGTVIVSYLAALFSYYTVERFAKRYKYRFGHA